MPILPLILAAMPVAAPPWEMVPPVDPYAEPCPLPADKWGTRLISAPVEPASNDVYFAEGGMLFWNGLPIDEGTLRNYMHAVASYTPKPRTVLYAAGIDCATLRRVAALIAAEGNCTANDCIVLPGPRRQAFIPPAPPAPASPPLSIGRRVTPTGSPQRWVTNDDYPAEAMRVHMAGTTGFRLQLDKSGKVTGCVVTSTSGHPLLDQTTCSLISRRATFLPALDGNGVAIPASWASRFRWELPDIDSPLASWGRVSRYRIDPSGAFSECARTSSGPAPYAYVGRCDYPVRSALDAAQWRGKPVRVEVRATHEVEGSPLPEPPATGETVYRLSVSYDVGENGVITACRVIEAPRSDPFHLRKYECHPGLVYRTADVAASKVRRVRFTVSVTVAPEP